MNRTTSRRADERTDERGVIRYYSRWPGLTLLTISGLVPWVAVLWAQLTAYMAIPWACGRGGAGVVALHVSPIVHLAIIAACGAIAIRDWRRTGGGVEDERDTVISRTRFASLWALGSVVFCALVIVALWLPMFIFDPCTRS
jgi:hypothetical protein